MVSLSTKLPLRESVSIRSIFVRVFPVPRTLSERRAVLGALQKYGQIEVFKKLREPSSFISVASISSVAQRLIESSPLQFEFESKSTHNHLRPGLLSQPLRVDSNQLDALDRQGLSIKGGANVRDSRIPFTLSIFPAKNYKHKAFIERSPLHGKWPTGQTRFAPRSFAFAALKTVVPKDVAGTALMDWETGGQSGEHGEARPLTRVDHISERTLRREARDAAKERPRSWKRLAVSRADQTQKEMPSPMGGDDVSAAS